MSTPRRTWRIDRTDRPRDEGSSLILALVLMIVGTMMVVPIMQYTMAVTRSNRVVSDKNARVEAVKGGLRVALYDPTALYAVCLQSGRNTSRPLAVPPGLNIQSSCTTTQDALQDVPSDQRYALATTLVGSGAGIPTPYVAEPERPELNGTMSPSWCTSMVAADVNAKVPCGKPYPANGAADPMAWMASTSTTTAGSTIFNPPLPPFSNTLAFAGGYDMPGSEPCKVYFPGRYTDPVVITGSTPVYFASGIYYFENTVRVSGNAQVVVGSGVTPGCVESDAVAVADAIGAPFDAYSSGVGGTFVFGANARLMIDTATAGATGVSLKFNRRLVDKTDPFADLNDISIMSVNGVWTGTGTIPYDVPAMIHVPVSPVSNGSASLPAPDPWTHFYKASNLVATAVGTMPCAAPPVPTTALCPIIDINFTTTASVTLKIPGYVSIPQGSLSLNVTPGSGVNKSISFGGGILAGQMSVPGEAPTFLQLGLLNPVVQKTFKITTETITGKPHVISVALVQVNETGGYAINSWVVQAG